MNKDTHNNFIDILKGFTIFLVLWGHAIQYGCANSFDFFEDWMFKIIYSFHMPLFMLISGYTFWYSVQKRSLSDVIIRRTRSMIQPIITWGIIYFFIIDFLGRNDLGLKQICYFIYNGTDINHFQNYWFLWSTLSCCIVTAIIWKLVKNNIRYLILPFGIVSFCLFPSTEQSIFLYPYFIIGFIFHENQTYLINKLQKFIFIPVIIYPILMQFYKKKHYIYVSGLYSKQEGVIESVKIDLFRWLIGFCGCIFFIVTIDFFYKKLSKIKMFIKLQKLGKNTLEIYCLQNVILSGLFSRYYRRIVAKIGFNPLTFNEILYDFLFTPIIAICILMIITFVIDLIKKTKLSKALFGR